jgi:hypothetical protein
MAPGQPAHEDEKAQEGWGCVGPVVLQQAAEGGEDGGEEGRRTPGVSLALTVLLL